MLLGTLRNEADAAKAFLVGGMILALAFLIRHWYVEYKD